MKESRIIGGMEVTLINGEVIIDDETVMELTDFCRPLFQIEYDPDTGIGMESITYEVAEPDEDIIAITGISLSIWGKIASWISETKVSLQCAYA